MKTLKYTLNSAWWYTPAIPAFGSQDLVYIARYCLKAKQSRTKRSRVLVAYICIPNYSGDRYQED
jgi:hypothetical protein